MKLCPQCNASALPFVMIALISGVTGFLTWLTLGLSDWGDAPRIAAALAACIAVAVTLWHYVVSCMRRHCRHGDHGEHADHRIRRATASS
jgi:peptidoglycan/LPS O-acetylase OafA/YrhL